MLGQKDGFLLEMSRSAPVLADLRFVVPQIGDEIIMALEKFARIRDLIFFRLNKLADTPEPALLILTRMQRNAELAREFGEESDRVRLELAKIRHGGQGFAGLLLSRLGSYRGLFGILEAGI